MIETLKEVRVALHKARRQITHADVAPHQCIAEAITKLDAMIAQVEKDEPVAWRNNSSGALSATLRDERLWTPLYTAPKSAPSTSPLTDKEIAAAWISIKDPVGLGSQFIGKNGEAVRDFVRAIEAAHGIGAKP